MLCGHRLDSVVSFAAGAFVLPAFGASMGPAVGFSALLIYNSLLYYPDVAACW